MKVTSGTIARTIILLLALINQVLTETGHPVIDVNNDTITEFISLAWTIVAALMAWWKNNSFTNCALCADKYKEELAHTKKEDTKDDKSPKK